MFYWFLKEKPCDIVIKQFNRNPDVDKNSEVMEAKNIPDIPDSEIINHYPVYYKVC